MSKKYLILTIAIFFMLCLLVFCDKKEEHQTGEIAQNEGAIDSHYVHTIKPKPINYDSMLTVIAPLIENIVKSPTDMRLRRELVETCYDTTWQTILAAGFGKPFQQANTETIAAKYAEQAATADAYRWAAYIKKWHNHPAKPDIGFLSTEIQGGRVVARKNLENERVSVLVEIHSSNIPD